VPCYDEKSKQLLKDIRPVKNTREGKLRQRDDEYERNGTRNIFVTVEPKGGYREVSVMKQRKKPDCAREIKRLTLLPRYHHAAIIHIVLDHLNTHCEKSFIETFGTSEAKRILSRLRFHYTPKHASWLNKAEIEIGILLTQSSRGRIPTAGKLLQYGRIWQKKRNRARAVISWKFTVRDARVKFQYNRRGSKLR
jgi:DDE superfamily endonuclease